MLSIDCFINNEISCAMKGATIPLQASTGPECSRRL